MMIFMLAAAMTVAMLIATVFEPPSGSDTGPLRPQARPHDAVRAVLNAHPRLQPIT